MTKPKHFYFRISDIARGLCLIFMLCAPQLHAQSLMKKWKKKVTDYELVYDHRYLEYSKWSFHLNNVMYAPAYAKKLEGVYDIDTKPMRGYNFGVRYTFNRDRQLSYYTGADIDMIPFYFYYYQLDNKDLPDDTPMSGSDYYKWINDHSVLTIPFGLQWKEPISERKPYDAHFIFSGDLRFHIIQPGGVENSMTKMNPISGSSVTFFTSYAYSRDINILSPTINLSAGIDWMTRWAILNINLNIQKGIVPYLRGEYKFHNLRVSPDTRGIYRVRADYVGIDLALTPRRWKRR